MTDGHFTLLPYILGCFPRGKQTIATNSYRLQTCPLSSTVALHTVHCTVDLCHNRYYYAVTTKLFKQKLETTTNMLIARIRLKYG